VNEIGYSSSVFDEKDIYLFLKKLIKSEFNTGVTIFSAIQSEDLIKNKAGSQYNENVQLLNTLENEKVVINKYLQFIKAFRLSELARMRKQLKRAYTQIKDLRELYSRDLFEKALVVYQNSDFNKDSCVLCETTGLDKNNVSFFEQLQVKANRYKDLKEHLERIKVEFKKLIEREQFLQIEDYLAQGQLISLDEKIISKLYHSGQELSSDFFDDRKIGISLKNYKILLQKNIKIIKSQTKLLYAKVPKDLPELINKSIKIKEIIDKLIDCKQKAVQIKEAEIYLSKLTEWTDFVSEIKATFENSFNDLMINISTDINKETKDFFYRLMKNSDISPLIIKETKGQKVNILLDKFYSADNKKASSLLSESYRNALCLSIYFASALKSKSVGNFLVLDDVCSSFDSGHQYYLLDLIRDKISRIAAKQGKQVIFLTHDGLLKKHLPKYSGDKWSHYSLSGNRADMSIKPYTSDDFKNLLINKINNGESIGSDLRSFYESVLIEIIEKLNIQVPFNLISGNDKKLVNNLLNALNDIVYLKLKARKTSIPNLPTKLDFKVYLQDIGNNLGHFASLSESSLSQSALTACVNCIIQIRQRFQYNCTCSKNLGWTYYKSLEGGKNDKGCTCRI